MKDRDELEGADVATPSSTNANDRRSRWRARPRGAFLCLLAILACDPASTRAPRVAAQEAVSDEAFVGLVERISEPGGYFDTDNLISNESGYLNVMDALSRRAPVGGAYVGVGPDQNFSYIAELRPAVAFIVDIRRDNLLHHLLLKAIMERSPTRIEFLSTLHGVPPPVDPEAWQRADVRAVVHYVDSTRTTTSDEDEDEDHAVRLAALQDSLLRRIAGYGMTLSDDDLATIRRFHGSFVEAGPSLRFTTHGRAPRPYYPTFRQLLSETDVDGDRVSYLASRGRYRIVRELQLGNRIVPVVGDLAGSHALRELGEVMAEMGVELTALYASNVEFYLWRGGTFERWRENLRALPSVEGAVVIRSYFPNFGRGHPSAVRGYYATQSLQPVATLVDGRFESYWDVVTRDAIPLR